MMLYRKNLLLSQELFTVISCFEVALRNSIDNVMVSRFGHDWLKNSATGGGLFDNSKCRLTKNSIQDALYKLHLYSHNKLVAELGFGFWRFMFAQNQFNATGRSLLNVFPAKPRSNSKTQYNNTYIFNQLASLNIIRNRLAHHEPICFLPGQAKIDTSIALTNYTIISELFSWMQIDHVALLYGLDHFERTCREIQNM